MEILFLVISVLVCAGTVFGLMFMSQARRKSDITSGTEKLQAQLAEKVQLVEKIKSLLASLVDLGELKTRGRELRLLKESLKTERGRITITQAELETVEGRLRELEEIDRELEASGIETKEEINILKKKEEDLQTKNKQLKEQIQLSNEQINQLIGQLKLSAEAEGQVMAMQSELLETQQKIDAMLIEIEQGNEQYFVLKRRYDALDIEYAQLFEKFSEAEAMAGKPAQK